ncbi:MAG: DUF5063 domain-containing protein [Deltaproteobacteria bacterium]|nr:DUF5063 domain-containing protein [Deltaproteobacteria bacterium]
MNKQDRMRIESFASAARRWCRHVEKSAGGPCTREALTETAALLADVYQRGLRLPDVPAGVAAAPEPAAAALAAWRPAGSWDRYQDIFDAYEDDRAVMSSLEQDVLDVYRDLKRGLARAADRTAGALQDAAWDWRAHFLSHWGRHAVAALRAVHHALAARSFDGGPVPARARTARS